MTLHNDIERGVEASKLLSNVTLGEAFTAIRKEYTDKWGQTRPEENAVRETLYLRLNALDKIEEMLKNYVNVGIVGTHKIYTMEDNN